jgi:hypothetical protein
MGDGVDGRVSSLRDFDATVRKTMAAIPTPGTLQEAVHYMPPPMPVETLAQAANDFTDALLGASREIEHWDTGLRGTGDFYATFATLLGAHIAELDQAHGDAAQDLYKRLGDQIPLRAG